MATIRKTPSTTWKAVIRERGWPAVIKTFRTKRDATDWARRTEDEMARGAETVLVVEDDPSVLAFTRRALESQGYVVLTAASGEEALRVLEEHDAPIHVLLTDVVLPTVSGPELALRVQAERPGIRVLFASGYTGEAMVQRRVLESGVPFIHKPFTLHTLADSIRSVIDARN